jgi:mono/diheme cytochrome c family protein
MSSYLTRRARSTLSRARIGVLFVAVLVGLFASGIRAQQSRTAKEGVYSNDQASRGQGIYKERCARCHGESLGGDVGPPLAGDDFIKAWDTQPLSDLVNKIQITMPADRPGQLTRQQAADIVGYMLQASRFAAGGTELGTDEAVLKQITVAAPQVSSRPAPAAAGQAPSFPPMGNLAQVMRGILFPNSNLLFDVQLQDPGAQPTSGPKAPGATTTGRYSDVYTGWQQVDYAAVALAEAAPLLMTPGRRCENGKPVPMDRPDWAKFTQELVDAGKAAYKASQSRSQDAVSEVTNQIAESCAHCHQIYRDKRNAADRCLP